MNKKAKTNVPKTEKKSVPFVRNLLFAAAVAAFLVVIFRENSGYSWVWNKLVGDNLKISKSSSHLTTMQKYQSKFGIDVGAIEYIAQNTPEDAVILFPPLSIMLSDSASLQFKKDLGGIKIRNWTLDLLYPRKLVYFDEKEGNSFFNQITHVVVMDGWGYDFVNYEVEQKNNFAVLPLKQ